MTEPRESHKGTQSKQKTKGKKNHRFEVSRKKSNEMKLEGFSKE